MRKRRHNIQVIRIALLIPLAVALLLCGCSGSDGPEQNGGNGKSIDTSLSIYVYTPEQMEMSRANIGEVNSGSAESQINDMQIWVFTHDDGELVGYLNPAVAELSSQQQATFFMKVSEEFAETHPNVDVYVLANMVSIQPSNSTRDDLETALLTQDGGTYGLTTLTTSVPGGGLPMSGVLRNQPVYGDAPVLRIGTSMQLATVHVTRVVSKVRFLFSKATDAVEDFEVNSVTLDGGMIPSEEYLFLAEDGNNWHIGNTYIAQQKEFVHDFTAIDACDDPSTYSYQAGTDANEYEQMVNSAILNSNITSVGPFYLRESDKRLSGVINYTIDGVQRQKVFQMANVGDFSRNHSWIVYCYYSGGNDDALVVNSIFVKDWNEVNTWHEIYNW